MLGLTLTKEQALKFAKLNALGLTAEKCMTMVQMRSCYILTLFMDAVIERTASAMLKDASSQRFVDKDVQDSLGVADSCCMSGHEQICKVWTACFEDLLLGNPLQVAEVLKSCGVKPVTATAKKTMKTALQQPGDAKQPLTVNQGDDDKIESVISVKSLLSFGSSDITPPSDVLLRLKLKIQAELCRKAAELETRERLHMHVTLSEDAKGRAKPDSKLLLTIPDPAACVTSPDGGHAMFKVSKEIKLVFFGEVGTLTALLGLCCQCCRSMLKRRHTWLHTCVRRALFRQPTAGEVCHPSSIESYGGWQAIRQGPKRGAAIVIRDNYLLFVHLHSAANFDSDNGSDDMIE